MTYRERAEDQVVTDALIGAIAEHYRSELPGDRELLGRIGDPGGLAYPDVPLEDFLG